MCMLEALLLHRPSTHTWHVANAPKIICRLHHVMYMLILCTWQNKCKLKSGIFAGEWGQTWSMSRMTRCMYICISTTTFQIQNKSPKNYHQTCAEADVMWAQNRLEYEIRPWSVTGEKIQRNIYFFYDEVIVLFMMGCHSRWSLPLVLASSWQRYAERRPK